MGSWLHLVGRQVKLPLEIGATLPTKWRRLHGAYQMAVVIERRPLPGGTDGEYEYYMHYEGCEAASSGHKITSQLCMCSLL